MRAVEIVENVFLSEARLCFRGVNVDRFSAADHEDIANTVGVPYLHTFEHAGHGVEDHTC